MKSKTLLLFGICALSFCSWEVQAMTPETLVDTIKRSLKTL